MDEGEKFDHRQAKDDGRHVLHEIRPSWSIDGTMKVLDRNEDHPAAFGELMSAAITAALDPDTQTPGRIYQVSIHWPEKAKVHLPKPPPCADHPEQDAFTCRCCWADVKAGIRPQTHIGKHHEAVSEEAALVIQEDE